MISNPFILITIILVNFDFCLCVVGNSNSNSNGTFAHKDYAPALATWDGNESTGFGSGAACGWEMDVKDPPWIGMIAAGNVNSFLKGKGCGHCYQLLCTQPPYCSGKPITVTISDECPGTCQFYFDLSKIAFGAMANPGQEDNLRQLGQVDVQYQRVPCNYGNTNIAFKVAEKYNPYYFSAAIEYANGDGGFESVEIAAGGSETFVGMENSWGAVWSRNIDPSFKPPYSIRLTSGDGKTIVATNVIPENFTPGQKYSSNVNFN